MLKTYSDNKSKRLKLIDSFLVFPMLSGIVQFLCRILVTNFPFNVFLAGLVPHITPLSSTPNGLPGFSSRVGQFALAASLRSQVNPENKETFKDVSPERSACLWISDETLF
jgi:oligosaccharyltransferase complex subunit epsilon